ncbi:hypothetical protein AVEN_265239-1 [Araneus ventricosus]|uniref:Uncharacterized protein n=1 Tax=Araneus ventricosus TaxID=182803 RepID=A0A4Y2S0C9_ARAVE|nr:hypothetical protein AVEN_265239-1 [Araneus ventricosus]
MTRTTAELEPPSPNFSTTPAEGRLTPVKFKAGYSRQHCFIPFGPTAELSAICPTREVDPTPRPVPPTPRPVEHTPRPVKQTLRLVEPTPPTAMTPEQRSESSTVDLNASKSVSSTVTFNRSSRVKKALDRMM